MKRGRVNLTNSFGELHNGIDELKKTYRELHEAVAVIMPYAQRSHVGQLDPGTVCQVWTALEEYRVLANRIRISLKELEHMIFESESETGEEGVGVLDEVRELVNGLS